MAACGTFLGYPTTPHTPSLCFFFFVLPRGLGDSRINPWRLRQRSHSYCVPTLRTVAARAKGHPVAVSRDCDNRATNLSSLLPTWVEQQPWGCRASKSACCSRCGLGDMYEVRISTHSWKDAKPAIRDLVPQLCSTLVVPGPVGTPAFCARYERCCREGFGVSRKDLERLLRRACPHLLLAAIPPPCPGTGSLLCDEGSSGLARSQV